MEDNNLDLLQNTFGTSLSIRVENYSFINYTTVTAGVDADTTVKVLNNLPKVNITLDGYFESHKYFSQVKDDLRLEFIFPRPIQDEVFKYFNSVIPILWKDERFVRVGIHVRRTDQITEERQTMGFIPQPPSYFIHAMEYFKQEYNRVQFIVTSDDLAWCKENILDEHIEFSTHNYTMDLAILSLSDHIIISLGTYSWWAGWLCKGTTIYYGVMPPNDTYLVEEHHYMTVYPVGRLGNQLFQYAVLYAVTRTNHTWIPVMMEDNNLDLLQNTFGTSLSIRVKNYSFINYTTVTAGVDADTTVKVLNNLPKVNITLGGYFESHKYFSQVKDDLRLEFIFPRPIQDEVFKYFNSVTPILCKDERFVRVGIHVRRTDQITEERQTMGFIPQPPSYFIHAMEYFKQEYNRVQFIVTSDDLAWCKENILDEHIAFSTHNYTMDLAILSLSDHIIISLGTYSWWAGWLCKGTTIYYGVMPPNDTYLG
ncbi:hypothetical protein LSH36_156g02010 [Paralvinella palmiformis]|uniref:L-Fucosyltransferase n=1 Tax=Paralvinella palmiformis TaxID=53620 RepID=A0AAD9JTP0_9ANNE|nr:hypothetical protein LSH36_156g02010 [Paralvinella palmiformis]